MQVEVVDANPLPWIFDPKMTVTIKSPANGSVNFLPVSVSFASHADNQFSVSDDYTDEWVRSFFYVLDGQDMGTKGTRFEGTKTTTISEKGIENGYRFDGQAYIANLADGPHNITVYYGAVNRIGNVGTPEERIIINPTWQATSQFYVMSSLPYIIGIVAVVILVIVGLLVYFKKYKHNLIKKL